jgi:large subunit ribosomal protein L5
VTLRNTEALEFAKRIILAKNNQLKKSSFDSYGNISIGIREHIDIPGAKYNPDIGIFGMNVCISLSRPGYRIINRSNPRKMGKKHRISKDEAIEYFKNLGVEMI